MAVWTWPRNALESVSLQDVELAATVITDYDRIDGRYLQIYQGALWLLACQAPGAGDLRIVAALLHIIRCVERMGDQCVNIAKLVRLSGHEATGDPVSWLHTDGSDRLPG